MLIHHKKKELGLTLVEMLIAMVLGLFVTAVIITVFSTTVRSNVENMKMIRLNQELRGAMGLMTDEFKRAGYSASSSITTFMDRTNFTSTCANYSYDINSNSSVDTVEYYGFRFDETNNEIDWGSGLTSTGCSTGSWQAITDSDIASITSLEFDTSGSVNSKGYIDSLVWTTTNGISIYEIAITLKGTTDLPHSSNAQDPQRTIIETIRVKNEAPK